MMRGKQKRTGKKRKGDRKYHSDIQINKTEFTIAATMDTHMHPHVHALTHTHPQTTP